jgi:hypothetical protein
MSCVPFPTTAPSAFLNCGRAAEPAATRVRARLGAVADQKTHEVPAEHLEYEPAKIVAEHAGVPPGQGVQGILLQSMVYTKVRSRRTPEPRHRPAHVAGLPELAHLVPQPLPGLVGQFVAGGDRGDRLPHVAKCVSERPKRESSFWPADDCRRRADASIASGERPPPDRPRRRGCGTSGRATRRSTRPRSWRPATGWNAAARPASPGSDSASSAALASPPANGRADRRRRKRER